MHRRRIWRLCGRALVASAGVSSSVLAQPAPTNNTSTTSQTTRSEIPSVGGLANHTDAKTAFVGTSCDGGDVNTTLAKLQATYDQTHNPGILLELANCRHRLRHSAQAETLLKRYLSEAPSAAPDRSAVTNQIEQLGHEIADVQLRVDVDGASIYLDDVLLGQSPLADPQRWDAGKHRLRIEKAGFHQREEVVEVKGGNALALNLSLSAATDQGHLRILTDGAADVFVDGTAKGKGFWSGTLPNGRHSVEITADKKQPYRSDVLVSDQQPFNLRVMLTNRDSESGFDSTWYWVLGSVLVAAGLGVASYHQFVPDHREPGAVIGTLSPGKVSLTGFAR